MSITIRGANAPAIVTYVPYSHMDERDADLFFDSLAALLTYANRRLGVVQAERVSLRGGCTSQLDRGAVVSEALWTNRGIIDDFVRDNPLGLTGESLDVVRPWRHAVRDVFTCIAADPDSALYMNDRRVFAVGALTRDADAFVHAVPSLMLLTLLPFKGGIVTDSKVVHLGDEPAPGALPLIAQQARDLLSIGVISHAHELVAYGRRFDGMNQISRAMQGRIDEHLSSLIA